MSPKKNKILPLVANKAYMGTTTPVAKSTKKLCSRPVTTDDGNCAIHWWRRSRFWENRPNQALSCATIPCDNIFLHLSRLPETVCPNRHKKTKSSNYALNDDVGSQARGPRRTPKRLARVEHASAAMQQQRRGRAPTRAELGQCYGPRHRAPVAGRHAASSLVWLLGPVASTHVKPLVNQQCLNERGGPGPGQARGAAAAAVPATGAAVHAARRSRDHSPRFVEQRRVNTKRAQGAAWACAAPRPAPATAADQRHHEQRPLRRIHIHRRRIKECVILLQSRPLCLFYFTHPFGVLSPEPPTLAAAPAHIARAFVNMEPVSPFMWSTGAASSDDYNTASTESRPGYELGSATVHRAPVRLAPAAARARRCTLEFGARDSISSSLFSNDVWFPSSSSCRSPDYPRRLVPYNKILPPLQLPCPIDTSTNISSSDDVWPKKCMNPEKFSLPPIELPSVKVKVVRHKKCSLSSEELSSTDSAMLRPARARRRLGVSKRRARPADLRRLLAGLLRRALAGIKLHTLSVYTLSHMFLLFSTSHIYGYLIELDK
ncbi:unnamed protein product [Chrysodeixis includens]|uniref:Uncharacterized protein n=1 Tax=Chrysodeixis includens TaxID=689277 RepID=A0A9N8Q1I4_CHRIL|nr:unnamed protein product [Chrysodeixis includens]